MKNKTLTILFTCLGVCFYNAQIAFEKTTIDGSGLIDFKEGTTKGIILPHIIDASTIIDATAGTFVFDSASARVKFYDGEKWLDMSGKSGSAPTLTATNENPTNQGVIVGSNTSTAKGVLIMESEDKALILPKVIDPVTNVKSPTAGMMCYDPTSKLICFYNGVEWTFWGDIE